MQSNANGMTSPISTMHGWLRRKCEIRQGRRFGYWQVKLAGGLGDQVGLAAIQPTKILQSSNSWFA